MPNLFAICQTFQFNWNWPAIATSIIAFRLETVLRTDNIENVRKVRLGLVHDNDISQVVFRTEQPENTSGAIYTNVPTSDPIIPFFLYFCEYSKPPILSTPFSFISTQLLTNK